MLQLLNGIDLQLQAIVAKAGTPQPLALQNLSTRNNKKNLIYQHTHFDAYNQPKKNHDDADLQAGKGVDVPSPSHRRAAALDQRQESVHCHLHSTLAKKKKKSP